MLIHALYRTYTGNKEYQDTFLTYKLKILILNTQYAIWTYIVLCRYKAMRYMTHYTYYQ